MTGPLDEFESETQSFAANPISLADVLALRVPVHWTEAVAVIEELSLVLLTGGEPSAIPEAESILITAQGTVLIRLGARGTQDVDAVGRMLNALLDPVTTPIPLRLFVAHSIGSDKYRSLQAFAEALAYYGRPDRPELVRELYQRCLNTSATLPADPPEAPFAQAAPPVPPPEPAENVVPRRRLPRWLPAAAALLLLILIPLMLTRGSGKTDLLSPFRGLGAAAAAAATNVVHSVQEFVSPAEPLDGKVEAEATDRANVSATRGTRSPSTSRRRGAPAATTSGSGLSSAEAAAPGVGSATAELTLPSDPLVLLPVQSGTVAEGALALPPPLAPTAAYAPVVVRTVDPVVYSSSSLDVQPPVIYSPKLPPLPPADPYWQGTNTMELLIDESGEVRQARLTSPPVRMSDMMLLSPAKTWKFHPALKNGQPVKYRLTMSWVVAPP
jgi:hypothetical protein